jgi:hypothetical protein
VSVLTTTPLKAAPSAAAGVAITTGAGWVYDPWVEVIAATAAPIAIAGVQITGGSYSGSMWDLDIGVGAASAEVSVGTLRMYLHNSGTVSHPVGMWLPVSLGGIGAGVRVAVRARIGVAMIGPASIALNYYENPSSDQASTSAQMLGSGPSGAGTATLTPNATPWANSPWVELVASAAADLWLLGLVHAPGLDAQNGLEYDLGTGGLGAETVITTVREASGATRIGFTWLPGPLPVAAGTRVAVRMRKAGTVTTAHPIAVLYYAAVAPTGGGARTQAFIWAPV